MLSIGVVVFTLSFFLNPSTSFRQQLENREVSSKVAMALQPDNESIQSTKRMRPNEDVSVAGSKPTMVDTLAFLSTICGSLKNIKRTGWVRHNVPLPESDSDHMHRCAMCVSFCKPRIGREAVNGIIFECVIQTKLVIGLILIFGLILMILLTKNSWAIFRKKGNDCCYSRSRSS